MGCGLNKLEKFDEKRPGNIYSTLKRPHVETKIDVSYEYRYVDFTTATQAEVPHSPVVRLSSLRDLPAQLHELYQQGFTVAALHPFVQSSSGRERIPQEQFYRAVLIKKAERNSSNDLNIEEYGLEMDVCVSSDQLADHKLIPDLVKRIEDAASQGSKFAGIIQGYCTVPLNLPPSPSDSLSHNSSPENTSIKRTCSGIEDSTSTGKERADCTNGSTSPSREKAEDNKVQLHEDADNEQQNIEIVPIDREQPEELNFHLSNEDVFFQDKITATNSTLSQDCNNIRRNEILAIFNKPKTQQRYRKYYTVNIPMTITKDGNTVTGLEANWLEHMTDHFRKGCTLVNAVFYLGMVNDVSSEFTDVVFIFEDYPEQEPKTVKRYDAIVVEQWTVLEGLEVQTDYMPLLNSLAAYGWQLTCVLSTPIVKTNRDGNVTTKQIVFMQRPALPHKMRRKEPKFQWRFSKDGRHSKKGKGKSNSRENQHMDAKKESDRNKKNKELTEIDDTVDGNLHVNHHVDGDIQSNSNDLNQVIITSPKQEESDEANELLSHNISLNVEGVLESVKEMDLGCVEKGQVFQEEVIVEGKEEDAPVNSTIDSRDGDQVEEQEAI
ncbi:raftlin [Discoglossus pictus]